MYLNIVDNNRNNKKECSKIKQVLLLSIECPVLINYSIRLKPSFSDRLHKSVWLQGITKKAGTMFEEKIYVPAVND